MDEITIFPASDAHDDQVDSFIQAMHYLYSANYLHAPLDAAQEVDEVEVDYDRKRRNVLNPYAQ